MNATQNPAASGEPPADVLRRAALYLTRHGWTQGRMYDLDHGEASTPPACVLGAIRISVSGHPAERLGDAEQSITVDRAMSALAHHLTSIGRHLDRPVWPVDGNFDTTVANWNDQPGRTVDEIVAELLTAADKYGPTRHTGGAR